MVAKCGKQSMHIVIGPDGSLGGFLKKLFVLVNKIRQQPKIKLQQQLYSTRKIIKTPT